MSTKSDGAKLLEAAQVLSAYRQAGALVLRVCESGPNRQWGLYILHADAVPEELHARLLELKPAVMLLLRRLAT